MFYVIEKVSKSSNQKSVRVMYTQMSNDDSFYELYVSHDVFTLQELNASCLSIMQHRV